MLLLSSLKTKLNDYSNESPSHPNKSMKDRYFDGSLSYFHYHDDIPFLYCIFY